MSQNIIMNFTALTKKNWREVTEKKSLAKIFGWTSEFEISKWDIFVKPGN